MKCRCFSLRRGTVERDADPDHNPHLERVATICDGWEAIFQCTLCGQRWHMVDTSGHAITKMFEHIDQQSADALIAYENDRMRQRAEKHAEWMERQGERLAEMEKQPKSGDPPLWQQLLVGLPILGGSCLAFAGMMSSDVAFVDKMALIGGALFVLGFGAAGLIWMFQRDRR